MLVRVSPFCLFFFVVCVGEAGGDHCGRDGLGQDHADDAVPTRGGLYTVSFLFGWIDLSQSFPVCVCVRFLYHSLSCHLSCSLVALFFFFFLGLSVAVRFSHVFCVVQFFWAHWSVQRVRQQPKSFAALPLFPNDVHHMAQRLDYLANII